MTRIALVASSYLPRLGGVEEHVHHLSRELRSRGHEVAVWAVDQGDEPAPAVDGIPVRYLPCPLPNRSVGGIARWLSQFPRARRLWNDALRADRPEIINIQCFGANGAYAWRLANRAGIPLVYSNHGETFMDAHNAFESSTLLRRLFGATLAAADAVTSCSAYAAADLDRFGSRSSAALIVGNGIDLNLATEPLPTPLPARYFAGVGRLVSNKGFDRLIEAFAQAVARGGFDNVELVIAGSGPELANLENLAAQSAAAERVHFVGPLGRGQIRALIDSSLGLVVPSDIEAFGIVVLEGWRSGVPVLVTNRGGPPNFVEDDDDALLFSPDDIGELADHLARVASDPELRQRIGRAGRVSAARFSWASVTDTYEMVFAAVSEDARSKV